MPLEKPDLYVVDKGLVTSAGGFDAVVSQVRHMLDIHPVIIIPSGILDSEQFRELRPMSNDSFDGAAPHDHEEPSCLVSDGSTRTPTLIFNARGAAEGTLELLHAGWRRQIEKLIARLPPDWDFERRFDAAITALEQHVKNPSLDVRNVHQDANQRRSLERIRSIVSNLARSAPGGRHIVHQYVADLQEHTASSTRAIMWEETGLLMFHGDVIHGRDVTKSAQRGSDEVLFMVDKGVRRTGSH